MKIGAGGHGGSETRKVHMCAFVYTPRKKNKVTLALGNLGGDRAFLCIICAIFL